MAKATIELPNGTKIEIDGTLEEVQALTQMYRDGGTSRLPAGPRPINLPPAVATGAEGAEDAVPDVAAIVAAIKDCDEAEVIERRVLDQKDVLNRVLLPLYAVGRYVNPNLGLTSGDIEKVTDQLGVKVIISSASTMLSGRAKSYVTGDAVRKRGGVVRYKLNRRGMQYFDGVLTGSAE